MSDINLDSLQENITQFLKEASSTDTTKKKIKMVKIIFRELKNGYKTKNGKVVLDLQLWVNIHNKDLFKKNSFVVHNLSKQLKNKKFVSSSSVYYPKNNVIRSTNPLTDCFLHADLNKYDAILNLRDEIKNKIMNISTLSLEQEIYIYYYLRLYSIIKIPNEYYMHFNISKLFKINKQIVAIFTLDGYEGFSPIKIIQFDKYLSKIFDKIFFNNQQELLKTMDHIFSKEISFYENELIRFCKAHNTSVKEFHNAIEFNYQLYHSPLELSLLKYTKYPKLSLFELNYLHPGSISKNLLKIEKNNMKIYLQKSIEEDDHEINLDNYLEQDMEVYDQFKKIKNVPNTKTLIAYLNKWYHFISIKKEKYPAFKQMFLYALFLLNKANKRVKTVPIKPKTLQGYFQVLFQYCFTYLVFIDNLETAIKNIFDNIKNNDNLTTKTKRHHRRIINHYLYHSEKIKLDKIYTMVNYNRSIVFVGEVDKLLNKLKYRDRIYKHSVLKLRRMVYVILLYYTGLRKNELLSRLTKDFYYLEDKNFVIDVNKNGMHKINKQNNNSALSLKNKNAKRRVKFSIDNTRHFNIVKKYFDFIKQENYTFLFPAKNNQTVFVKRAMHVKFINEISPLLQDITKRYTPLHSFRHSYATNEISKILTKKDRNINDIFDLSLRMGHSEPDTTLTNYVHLDLICKNEILVEGFNELNIK